MTAFLQEPQCFTCRKALIVTRLTNYRYSESGLTSVTLDGIQSRECVHPKPHRDFVVPHMEALHREIAHRLANKSTPLMGSEHGFLRKWLGFDQIQYARRMHVTNHTISAWERDRGATPWAAEALLRQAALTRIDSKAPSALEAFLFVEPGGTPTWLPIHLCFDGSTWRHPPAHFQL